MLHNCTLLKHGSRLHDAALWFNQAVLYVLSKVEKPGMVLKDEQLTAIQHVHYGKNVFVWLYRYMAKWNFLWGLTVCTVPCVHFGKAEADCSQTSKPRLYIVTELLMRAQTVALFSPHQAPGNEATHLHASHRQCNISRQLLVRVFTRQQNEFQVH